MPGLVLACVALAALSLLLPSTPTYDPWAWIIWGREVVQFDLDTRTGPSWKPLAVVFTAPFALVGDEAAPELWLIVARAGALLALALAFRLARRLAGETYGVLAGTAAAAILLVSNDWIRNAGFGNSEGVLVALLFWAIERHLDGRRDHAIYLGFAAALLRPEVWPFLGLYWLWLWVREPGLRVRSTILMALIPAFWLIPELIGSGDAFRASTRAQTDIPVGSPGLADQPWRAILESADRLVTVGGELLALAAVAIAAIARPRNSRVLWFALGTVTWVVLVIAMTEAGYSGNQRYLVPAGAGACVLAGVGLAGVVGLVRSAAGRRLAIAVAALVCGLVAVGAIQQMKDAHKDLRQMKAEAHLNDDIPEAIEFAGGRDAVVACGPAYTGALQITPLAWYLNRHTDQLTPSPPKGRAVMLAARDRFFWSTRPKDLSFDGGTREWLVSRCR